MVGFEHEYKQRSWVPRAVDLIFRGFRDCNPCFSLKGFDWAVRGIKSGMKNAEMLIGEASGQMIECYLYVDHISMFNRTFIIEVTMYRWIKINASSEWKRTVMQRLPSGPCEWLSIMCALLMTSKEILVDKMDTITASEDSPKMVSKQSFLMILNGNICSFVQQL